MYKTPVKKNEQWIQSLSQHEQAEIELICFPFAGGGTTTYRPWMTLLSPTINLSAVLLPGREIRIQQTPESDIDTVCNTIVDEIMTKYSKKPLVFFGHSMGSMLAYEVARRLQQHNIFLKALIVSGRQAPHLYFGGDFHKSPDDVFIQELKRFGQTSDVIFEDQEMRNLILPMLRADYSLLENYYLGEPIKLNCPLLTCTGKDDTEVTPAQIQCWQELSSGKVQHQIFSGGHFYLTDAIVSQELAQFIKNNVGAVTGN